MPAKNHLSQKQRERLLKTLKEQENPYIREKVLILLLMNDGKTYQEISDFLDIAYPSEFIIKIPVVSNHSDEIQQTSKFMDEFDSK
jgi:ubiquinone biosynthesis protein COQ9